jgi:membrane-associated phospholipid phosphatase
MPYRFTFIWIFIWLFINGILPGQSPYAIMGGQEAAFGGAGLTVLGVSIPISHGVDPLTPEEVAALRAEDVWGFDRWGTQQWSPGAQRASDKFLYGSFALPATMLLDRPSRSEFDQVGLLTLESLLLSVGLTNLTKALVKRPRPFMYNPEVPLVLKTRRRSRYSFFSGHTSLTATSTFLTAKLYHDFYPDSDARPYVWATAAVIPAITGYLRVRGGKHYLTDVLIGYGVGAAIGVLVPQLHK